jgi:amino acid transporter
MSTNDLGTHDSDRLAALGYKQELSRVLSLFDNFSVAFAYLSPMVGIYSLYTLGLGMGGPRYIWTMPVVVGLMMLVALVFGELASEYPLSGALYQYGKYNVGPRYGWFVGWIYGFALLATVASVDSGVVSYVTSLSNIWFNTHLDPANHITIFAIVAVIIVLSGILNSVGAKVMGRVAGLGVYVETIGTFGVAIALAIHGFNHGFGYTFTTQGVQNAATNPFAVNFGGHWLTGAALVAVLANVYIFYGFESAGDIAEETKEAGRQVPRAMRNALLYGGIASFVLVLGLLLATPKAGIGGVISGGIPSLLAVLPAWLQDFFLVMVIIAFFSCGTAVQGAGARVAFGLARDGAVPFADKLKKVNAKHKTPVNDRPVPVLAARSGEPVEERSHPVVRLPGPRERFVRVGVLRCLGHLPLLPAHRRWGAHRAQPRLGAERFVHPGKVGDAGHRRRCAVPVHHAVERGVAELAEQWPRWVLQLRMGHLAGDASHRHHRSPLRRVRSP